MEISNLGIIHHHTPVDSATSRGRSRGGGGERHLLKQSLLLLLLSDRQDDYEDEYEYAKTFCDLSAHL
jgi:hypothetical protein